MRKWSESEICSTKCSTRCLLRYGDNSCNICIVCESVLLHVLRLWRELRTAQSRYGGIWQGVQGAARSKGPIWSTQSPDSKSCWVLWSHSHSLTIRAILRSLARSRFDLNGTSFCENGAKAWWDRSCSCHLSTFELILQPPFEREWRVILGDLGEIRGLSWKWRHLLRLHAHQTYSRT